MGAELLEARARAQHELARAALGLCVTRGPVLIPLWPTAPFSWECGSCGPGPLGPPPPAPRVGRELSWNGGQHLHPEGAQSLQDESGGVGVGGSSSLLRL